LSKVSTAATLISSLTVKWRRQ